MKSRLLAVFLCAPALAAAPPADYIPRSEAPYWFKTYSTAPYQEIWTAELVVKNLNADLPKLVSAVEKGGGALTQPLSTFISSKTDHTQQIVFSIPGEKAKLLLKSLRKIGELPEPAVRPLSLRIPIDEVRAKIKVLMAEKTERAAELKKAPATAAAAEEILEHLLLVEEVYDRTDGEVRFNLSVRQK
jgi:hypothetical protein